MRVSALWETGGTWYEDHDLSTNAPSAATGRGLAYNDNLGELYYVANDSKIWRLYYSSGWQSEQVASGQWNNAKSNSELKVPSWGTDIVYVRADGTMCKLSKSGSSWYDSGPIVSGAPKVKDGSDFDYSDDGIFYIDVDSKIQKMAWSSSAGWYCEEVKERQLNVENSVVSFDGQVYFTYDWNDNIYSYSLLSTKSSNLSPGSDMVPQFELEYDYTVYPNPSNGDFYISGLMESVKVTVFNVQGSIIYRNDNYMGEKIIIPNLGEGMLFVKILDSTNKPQTKKIIIR